MRYLSLFSGIEAASAAWGPLGWECVGVAEIEPFPCSVLSSHHPAVPNLGDVTKVTAADIFQLGPIDLVVFGSPCQDLSVAGKRKGFADVDGNLTRSGLFHVAVNIIEWAREYCGCRFALWENVPGAFSSNAGRDFAAVVEHLAGCAVDVPPKGWGTEGCAAGKKAMVEWAVLDAQWFGVAQRRRRVFALADFGDWPRRPPVLLEPDRLRGDSAPRREAGQGVAGTLGARTQGGGGLGTDFDLAGGCQPVGPVRVSSTGELSHCLNAGGMGRIDFETETMIAESRIAVEPSAVCPTLRAGGNATGGDRPPGTDVDTADSLIPIAYRTNASGCVMGQGDCAAALTTMTDPTSQFVAYGFQPRIARNGRGDMGDVVGALSAQSGETGKGDAAPCVVMRESGPGYWLPDDVAGTLRAEGEDRPSRPSCVIAFAQNSCDEVRLVNGDGRIVGALAAEPGMKQTSYVASGWQVRRLTPTECERLQGFSDGHTAILHRGKPAADGPRYKALGNSMAVPVMNWIGRSLQAALWDVWA